LFNYIIRNTSFDGPQSAANRTHIPKNIKANNRMNFTTPTSWIGARDILKHIFLFSFSINKAYVINKMIIIELFIFLVKFEIFLKILIGNYKFHNH
jgi:hypothetical protein